MLAGPRHTKRLTLIATVLVLSVTAAVVPWSTQMAFMRAPSAIASDTGVGIHAMTVGENRSAQRAPKARIQGGTRGRDSNGLVALPLVPDHVGLTVSSQPDLYWYLSGPTTSKVLFVLVDTRSIHVVHEQMLTAHSGVQRIRFKDFGITLEPNVIYRWYLDVVLDMDMPSRDIVSGGMIQRVQPTFNISDIARFNSIDLVRFYAEQGLWYDAIDVISELIAAAPNDHVLRKQRASLLEQVGLQEVSEWDKLQVATDSIVR